MKTNNVKKINNIVFARDNGIQPRYNKFGALIRRCKIFWPNTKLKACASYLAFHYTKWVLREGGDYRFNYYVLTSVPNKGVGAKLMYITFFIYSFIKFIFIQYINFFIHLFFY